MGSLTHSQVVEALAPYQVERCITRSGGKHMSVNVAFPSGRTYGFDWLIEDGLAPVLEWVKSQSLHDEQVVAGMAAQDKARGKR